MSAPSPYLIHISDERIDRLRQKLAIASFPGDDIESDETWAYGPPRSEIRRLTRVWLEDYDWRKAEARLNKLEQFTTEVALSRTSTKYTVHFLHRKSSSPNAVPLLFLHGWPGSFLEASKIVDLLAENDSGSTSFDIVAPSLLDFGFSSRTPRGFTLRDHAEIYASLMRSLGYERYVVQAGDVGSLICRFMAKNAPSSGLVAYHTNTPWPTEPSREDSPDLFAKAQATPLTAHEQQGLIRLKDFASNGRAYYSMMATRPMTIGYALSDSPVALLAWIYEKLRNWSDGYPWTDEEILTWVSVHYFSTAGPDAPSNAYYAMDHDDPPVLVATAGYVDLPLGISRFKNDLVVLPRLWNQGLGPVVFEEEHERGGHFAAWEQPEALVADLRVMFRKDGPLGHLFSG